MGPSIPHSTTPLLLRMNDSQVSLFFLFFEREADVCVVWRDDACHDAMMGWMGWCLSAVVWWRRISAGTKTRTGTALGGEGEGAGGEGRGEGGRSECETRGKHVGLAIIVFFHQAGERGREVQALSQHSL